MMPRGRLSSDLFAFSVTYAATRAVMLAFSLYAATVRGEAIALRGELLSWMAMGFAMATLIAAGGFWVVWRRARAWSGAADPRAARGIVIGSGVLAAAASPLMDQLNSWLRAAGSGGWIMLVPPLGFAASPLAVLVLSAAASRWAPRYGRAEFAGPAAAQPATYPAQPVRPPSAPPAALAGEDRGGAARGRFWPQVVVFAITYVASLAVTLADNAGDPELGRETSYTLALVFQSVFVAPVAVGGFAVAWWRARSWPGARINEVGALIAAGAGVLVPVVNDRLRVFPLLGESPAAPDIVLIPWTVFGPVIAAFALSLAARILAAAMPFPSRAR